MKARRNLPNEHEWTYVQKDGTTFLMLLSVTALRDSSGAITGFLGLAINITAQKESEATADLRPSHVPIIAMTANALQEDRDRC